MCNTIEFGSVVGVNKLRQNFVPGELVLFYPWLTDSTQSTDYFIQRVAAAPGDTFKIEDKTVYVNGIQLPLFGKYRFNYFIGLKKGVSDSVLIQGYKLNAGGSVSDQGTDFCYALSTDIADSLIKDTLIASVKLRTEKSGAYDPLVFPSSINFRWNKDWYGPLIIPYKGQVIALDSTSIKLYGKLLNMEGHSWQTSQDSIWMDGSYTPTYTVMQDYYFVLGDDRDNANDSRSWGFLPTEAIVGGVFTLYVKSKR